MTAALPIQGTILQIVPVIGEDYSPDASERVDTEDLTKAHVITSTMKDGDRHKVVLDLDLPAELRPSSTPGHFHLYVDKEIDWPDYVELLTVLAKCGIVEAGYVGASVERGYTAARLPWVLKPSAVPE